jgi:hypothetical protein
MSPHERLAGIQCPRCGGPLAHGYIAGHWTRLRWCERATTKTIFAGKPLRRERDLWNAPTVEAGRCERCRIGVFVYDQ